METLSTDMVYRWLEDVKDPEIPVLSLVDLGVIAGVDVTSNAVKITLSPTFVGCPAIDLMQQQIRELLTAKGVGEVGIEVTFKTPWTSDLITEKGKLAMKKFGLAPPPPRQLFEDIDILSRVTCPRCGSNNTELRNPFGPTLCRSIHYCNDCREAFEQFKPL